MKTSVKIFFTLLYLIISISILKSQSITEGNNQFSFEFYEKLKVNSDDNIFYSPFSIRTAMAMVYAGAKNETAREIAQTMHYEGNEGFHIRYKRFMHQLDNGLGDSISFLIANGLFMQYDYPFIEKYVNMVHENYGGEASKVNFKEATEREKAREKINAWALNKTNNKISNLLGRRDLNSSTKAVLVNTIYFKSKWNNPFSNEVSGIFKPDDHTSLNTMFLENQGTYNYYEDEHIKVLEIAYYKNKASLIIFLPVEKETLSYLEKTFTYDYYQKVTNLLIPTGINIKIPKFEISFRTELQDVLSMMGMPSAFTLSADFSNMTERDDLYIGKVIHQANINLTLTGTEASAATAVTFDIKAAPIKQFFNADHPFIFCIRENETGSILFMGRVMDPGSKNAEDQGL